MPSESFLTYGSDTPPVAPQPLRAGPFTLGFDAGDLRYVKLGEREVIRRLYAAVRDENWDTIPGRILDSRCSVLDTQFQITYRCEHRRDGLHFMWDAEITGDADGTIRFTFDGEAKTTFLRNRIGFCVLHPIRECAGARCRAQYVDGTEQDLAFPDIIAPEQPIAGLHNLAGLAHEITPGVWAELSFEGDAFETEDQRNWTDASFKTFCTPLRLPRPVEIAAGTRIRQSVTLRLIGKGEGGGRRTGDGNAAAAVEVGVMSRPWTRLPELGLGMANHGRPPTEQEIARLGRLNLSHLRIDLNFSEPGWEPKLRAALLLASNLGNQLEAVVHLSGVPERDLSDLVGALTGTHGPSYALATRLRAFRRLLVLSDGEKSTTAKALSQCRSFFRQRDINPHQTPIGAGTNADLYQLNLQRPPTDTDFICWSMNPQVHARDNASITETPAAAAQQVASVKEYFPGAPLVVSPITLRPRFNPVASGREAPVLPGELPPSVDPRQLTLFGAAWTVAMLAALLPSGVESLTFFETTGWCGVMETAAGSPLSDKFPSEPGQVFPLWHAFAALNGFRNVTNTTVSDPLKVAALAISDQAGRQRIVLANLSAGRILVNLAKVAGGSVRILDSTTVATATRDPEAFWHGPGIPLRQPLPLGSHALAFLDIT